MGTSPPSRKGRYHAGDQIQPKQRLPQYGRGSDGLAHVIAVLHGDMGAPSGPCMWGVKRQQNRRYHCPCGHSPCVGPEGVEVRDDAKVRKMRNPCLEAMSSLLWSAKSNLVYSSSAVLM